MKHILLSLLALAFVGSASADPNSDDPARPTFGRTGQLFALKFVPGTKRITISFAATPLVALGPAQVTVIARQYPISGKPQDLNIHALDDGFHISDELDPKAPLEIEVHNRGNQKSETFKVVPTERP